MINIEKRKFLTELSRLLTFMFDEDRQTALSMYDEMFESTDDTKALLELLVSPTRQAVMIARAYNAKERDLEVRSKTGDADADVASSKMPRFMKVIGDIADKASELCPPSRYSTVWEQAVREEPEQEGRNHYEESEEPEPEAERNDNSDDPFSFAVTELSLFHDDESEPLRHDEEEKEALLADREAFESETSDSEDEEEEFSAEEHSRRINEYIAAFDDSGTDVRQNTVIPKDDPVREEIRSWRDSPVSEEKAVDNKSDSEEATGEINILLLILYIILAVPLTAIGVLLLLIPAVLCLSIAFVLAVVGFQTITTAFGGFAVFADIMVVLGGALIVIAIALCAFWAFIWFIGGAIVSLINSAIRLGGNFCTAGGGR